jgi:Fur family ferric uptake transcriptional regulator
LTTSGPATNAGSSLQSWAEFLAAHHLRATEPRRLIAQAIAQSPGHFDAETLRLRLRGQGRRFSRATIYRTLALLQSCGILRRVQLVEGTLHYELSRPNDPHHHLVCRRCGRTVEVEGPTVERWADKVAAEHGYAEVSHTVEIFGTCSSCLAGQPVPGQPVAGQPAATP